MNRQIAAYGAFGELESGLKSIMQQSVATKSVQNAFIYCRVSTGRQAEEGYSLDAQEKNCYRFAEANSYRVIDIFREEGRTGTNTRRPALQNLLLRCQEDKSIRAVLMQETDRLARSAEDHMALRAIFRKADINIISIEQPMIGDTPEGKMMDTMVAGINEFFSDINSRKTKKGLQEKFDCGWWPGCAPLGYLNRRTDENKNIIVEDPEKLHLIKQGLKIYLTGNLSVIEVAETLYKKGLSAKGGKRICNSVMNSVLRNPFYAGIMKWNGQEKAGNHKAIISVDEHRQILAIMDGHNQFACRRRKHNFLLRGFVFCDICGQRYTAEIHTEKGAGYYHCGARTSTHVNKGQNIRIDNLEEQVEKYFEKVEFSEDFIEMVIQKVRKFYDLRKNEKEKEKRVWLNKIMAAKRNRDIAEEKLLARTLEDEDFIRIRDKFRSEISTYQARINEIDLKHDVNVDTIREILMLSKNVAKAYRKASPEVKRLYLGFFWKGFWVRNKKIVKSEPTELIKILQNRRKIIIRSNWHGMRESNPR